MTSVISPTLFARVNAAQAATSLGAASSSLRADVDLPVNPQPPLVGIPEHNGPDSPDNPWFIGTPDRHPVDPGAAAVAHARTAVERLTASLSVGNAIGTDVRSALMNAKAEAEAGVRVLTNPPANARIGRTQVALQFDGAALWANLAVSLIDLNQQGRRPEKSIEPLPNPGHIQLPPPGAEIQ
jgi:hypothetical protein